MAMKITKNIFQKLMPQGSTLYQGIHLDPFSKKIFLTKKIQEKHIFEEIKRKLRKVKPEGEIHIFNSQKHVLKFIIPDGTKWLVPFVYAAHLAKFKIPSSEIGPPKKLSTKIKLGDEKGLVSIYKNVEIGDEVNFFIGEEPIVIRANVRIMGNASIYPGVTISRGTIISEQVTIGQNTTIGENCRIAPLVSIGKNVSIGNQVTIEELVYIEDGTIIKDGTKIFPDFS